MEDTGGKSGRRPGSHPQVEASGREMPDLTLRLACIACCDAGRFRHRSLRSLMESLEPSRSDPDLDSPAAEASRMLESSICLKSAVTPLCGRVIFQYFASRLGRLDRRLGRAHGERNRCAAPEQAPLPIFRPQAAPSGGPALPQAVARPTRPRARPPRAGRPVHD